VLLTIPPSSWCAAYDDLAKAMVEALLDIKEGTVPHEEQYVLAANLCAALMRKSELSREVLRDLAQQVRIRFQRAVASCSVAALPDVVLAAGACGVLDSTAAGYVNDRIRSRGAPFEETQRTLAAMAQYGARLPSSATPAAQPIVMQNRRATGALTAVTDLPAAADHEPKAMLMSRLALALHDHNTRSVEAVLVALAAARGDDAVTADEAFTVILGCTRPGSKVPPAKVALTQLACRCPAPIDAIIAASRVIGHVDSDTVNALVNTSLASLHAVQRPTKSDGLDHSDFDADERSGAQLVARVDTINVDDAFAVLHSIGWTRRWPHPQLLRALRRGPDQLSAGDACEAIRLAARYGIDDPLLLKDLAQRAVRASSPLSPAALDELAYVATTAFGRASHNPVTGVLQPIVEQQLSDIVSSTGSGGQPELVCLLSAAVLCGVSPDSVAAALERLDRYDAAWPLRASLVAFGHLTSPASKASAAVKAKVTAPWKESVKRLARISVTDVPMSDAHTAAECLHVVAAIAKASLDDHRRPPVSDLVSRAVDGAFCRGLTTEGLISLIAFFSNDRERGSLGIIKCDAALAVLWAALELRLDRVRDEQAPMLAATCPELTASQLLPSLARHIRTAASGHFASCVGLLSRHEPKGAWVADAKARFAEVAWEIPPAAVEATRAALK
jgi:hypothetical protein